MKSKSKLIISSVLVSFLSLTAISSASAAEDITQTSAPEATVSLVDEITGEVTYLEAKQIKKAPKLSRSFSASNAELIEEVEYEVFVPIPDGNISSRASGSNSKNSGGVTAKVQLDYSLNSKGDMITVSKLSGSWTPSSNIYSVTSRSVGAHSGLVVGGQKMSKVPTSNTFSYTTGWKANSRLMGGNSPRGWADAVIKVSGMSGSHKLTVEVTV